MCEYNADYKTDKMPISQKKKKKKNKKKKKFIWFKQ